MCCREDCALRGRSESAAPGVEAPLEFYESVFEPGAETLDTGGLDVHDPWGNRLQIVAYEDVRFAKAEPAREERGLSALERSADALAQLAERCRQRSRERDTERSRRTLRPTESA